MRKVWFLAFSSLIFLLSFSFNSARVNAVAENSATSYGLQQEDQTNYELPYPGLLPDNPLYFLRVIRDRVVGFLISDPLKKSEFDLLQADKRLNAGIYLFNKGKTSLALSTVSKAENYFDSAINKMGEAKKQGSDASGIEGKLKEAIKKHEQELEFLSEKTSSTFKQSFEKELTRVKSFKDRLNR